MFKKVLVAVLAIVAVFLVYVLSRPNTFHIERSLTVKAPPERIAALIADFHAWPSWSPYEKLDPGMKKTFSGPAKGKGAVYEWQGNDKAGAGRMEITDLTPGAVKIKLDFIKPFQAHDTADFTLKPSGDSTTVTWAMDGPSPFLMKLMSVFINFDKVIGAEFETGLGNLKTVAEKPATS